MGIGELFFGFWLNLMLVQTLRMKHKTKGGQNSKARPDIGFIGEREGSQDDNHGATDLYASCLDLTQTTKLLTKTHQCTSNGSTNSESRRELARPSVQAALIYPRLHLASISRAFISTTGTP